MNYCCSRVPRTLPLQTTALQRRWREGFEGTRTHPPKQFNAALRPRRRTAVREAGYEDKVGKRYGTGDQGFSQGELELSQLPRIWWHQHGSCDWSS